MPDREKVIRGLECCVLHDPEDYHKCNECLYRPEPGIITNVPCSNRMMWDALALLKGQKPRVLTLEEVRNSEGKALVLERCLRFGDGKSSTWWSWVLYKNDIGENSVFADIGYISNTYHQIDKYGKEGGSGRLRLHLQEGIQNQSAAGQNAGPDDDPARQHVRLLRHGQVVLPPG